MASPAQSALARSPVLWELTSPKLRESPVRAAFGPSLRPSQGTYDGVTKRTQLVAPSMSFPPPYAESLAQVAFIRLPNLKTFVGYGDFPQHIATCKYCGVHPPPGNSSLGRTRAACSRLLTAPAILGRGLMTSAFWLHGS